MIKSENSLSILHDPNYLALEQHYLDHPTVLYTGAGVSWARDARYGLRGWDDFVRRILIAHEPPASPALAEFDRKAEREWADKPWDMADWVVDRCGPEAFKRLVVDIVQREENFQRKWPQLSGRFLGSAATLNAVSAFCAQLGGVVEGTKAPTLRVSANRRVCAVVSSNYDCFLEAASASMFIREVLKPVGAVGSGGGRLDQIPVFHVHGYGPLPERVRKKRPRDIRRPFVDPVVTTSDYEAAWQPENVYCPTMGPQIHCLRHYATLFIGFSFRDRWVNGLLRDLNVERRERRDRLYHYALMHRDEMGSRGKGFFSDLGVRPIAVASFSEIPALLGHLYRQGLARDHGEAGVRLPLVEKRRGTMTRRDTHLSAAQYWDALYRSRNRAVRRLAAADSPDHVR